MPSEANGQLLPRFGLVLGDYARHIQLAARGTHRPSYLDVLHRLAVFDLDPLEAGRGDRSVFSHGLVAAAGAIARARSRPARATPSWAPGAASMPGREARAGLRLDDPTLGIRPPSPPALRPRSRPQPRAGGPAAGCDPQRCPCRQAAAGPGPALRAHRPPALRDPQSALAGTDLEGGHYSYTGKGGTERRRVLPEPARRAILAYAEASGSARQPDQVVFSGRWPDQPLDGSYLGLQLKQAAQVAGPDLERPLHSLRHTYARALRQVEAPLEQVHAALDHSNLATTSVYLRQLQGDADPWWPKLSAAMGIEASEAGNREAVAAT